MENENWRNKYGEKKMAAVIAISIAKAKAEAVVATMASSVAVATMKLACKTLWTVSCVCVYMCVCCLLFT